jgi:hypothetical protein
VTNETKTISVEETALREMLNAEFFAPPEYDAVAGAIADQFGSVAVRQDDSAPWSPENRQEVKALLVTGLSRAGKSHAVKQALAELDPIQTVDGQVIPAKPIIVECSSIFDPAELGSHILHKVGYPARDFSAPVAWGKVRRHLPLAKPAPLVIEEYQYTFAPTGVGPKRVDAVRNSIQGLFRSLLDLPAWPTPIVFVGTQSVLKLLEHPDVKHVREKIKTVIRIAPVTRSKRDLAQLREAIDVYCDTANVRFSIPEEDFLPRLIHSCCSARGLVLDLMKDTVIDAWKGGSGELVMKHFADRYRLHTGAHDHANPFIETAWHNTNPDLLLEAVDGLPQTMAPKKAKATK